MRYLSNEPDAADALQESFIAAFHKMNSVKEPSSFEGWLRRLVVNKCLEMIRERKKNLIAFPDKGDIIDESGDIDYNEIDPDKLKTVLFEAVNQLSDGYRTIINMALIEEYSHAEIADALGISESTSRSQLARARVQLKRILMVSTDANIKEYYYG